jgi:hypothetical protein
MDILFLKNALSDIILNLTSSIVKSLYQSPLFPDNRPPSEFDTPFSIISFLCCLINAISSALFLKCSSTSLPSEIDSYSLSKLGADILVPPIEYYIIFPNLTFFVLADSFTASLI